MCHRIGRPPISTIGLGREPVSSARRVPSPPANKRTFIYLYPLKLVFSKAIKMVRARSGRAGPSQRTDRWRRNPSSDARIEGASYGFNSLRSQPAREIGLLIWNFSRFALEPESEERGYIGKSAAGAVRAGTSVCGLIRASWRRAPRVRQPRPTPDDLSIPPTAARDGDPFCWAPLHITPGSPPDIHYPWQGRGPPMVSFALQMNPLHNGSSSGTLGVVIDRPVVETPR